MPILGISLIKLTLWTIWLIAVCATAIALGQAYFQRNNDHNDP